MSGKTMAESGYEGNPFNHVDYQRAPVSVTWWATKPNGCQSEHWHAVTFYRLRQSGKLAERGVHGDLIPVMVPTEHYGKTNEEMQAEAALMRLPALPRGYVWHGPFFRHAHDRNAVTPAFGDHGTHVVAEHIPSRSAGRLLTYVFDPQTLEIGMQIGEQDEPTPGPLR